jgi:predicted ATP-dependent protease
LDIKNCKVKAKDLSKTCKPSIFKFASTAEIDPLKGIIGQERAVRSLNFALDIDNDGYNIYLAGYLGTGKATLAREILKEKAQKKKRPSDWCYVNNFKNLESPIALSFPAGVGKEFKKDVTENTETVLSHIMKALEGEEFESQKSEILKRLMEETNQIYVRLEEEARVFGFTISRANNTVSSIPLKEDGEHLSQDEYMAMSENDRNQLMKKSALIQEKINESFRQYKEIERLAKESIKELELETARQVSDPDFTGLYEKYSAYPKVLEYLHDMHRDVLHNLDMFKNNEEESPLNFLRRIDKRALSRRYQVNLIVDNSNSEHAPIVVETNPSYSNLFGQIEFESEFGVLSTDFSKIKPGSIHKANGGYLVFKLNLHSNQLFI